MIETERLKIFPLTHEQLLLYIENDHKLDISLGLNPSKRTISTDLKEAMEETILPNVADKSKNYLFNSLWTIILKSENVMVGDYCFFGEPKEDGTVEMGYGTYDAYQGNGYMSEAISAAIQWVLSQENVKTVLADTEKANIASYKILEKNGFVKYTETETLLRWQLEVV
jgi:[ribosomal protein S5]-alanine N-acetyltransferase